MQWSWVSNKYRTQKCTEGHLYLFAKLEFVLLLGFTDIPLEKFLDILFMWCDNIYINCLILSCKFVKNVSKLNFDFI